MRVMCGRISLVPRKWGQLFESFSENFTARDFIKNIIILQYKIKEMFLSNHYNLETENYNPKRILSVLIVIGFKKVHLDYILCSKLIIRFIHYAWCIWHLYISYLLEWISKSSIRNSIKPQFNVNLFHNFFASIVFLKGEICFKNPRILALVNVICIFANNLLNWA